MKPKLISTSTEESYNVKRHYGIVGCSTRVLRAKISGDDSGDDFVLKISYPEVFRIAEPDMLIRAKKIADKKLHPRTPARVCRVARPPSVFNFHDTQCSKGQREIKQWENTPYHCLEVVTSSD